jgi:hypothetical protein
LDSPTFQSPPAIGPEPAVWSELLALPWRRYEILSHLQPGEALAAITRVTTPGRSIWRPFRAPATDFEGRIGADGFAINRVIRYRNSFLPMIAGRITPAATGTLIAISMRPMWFVLIFWLFWMTCVAAFFAIALFRRNGVQHRPDLVLLASGMFAVGYLICSVGFGVEARWAKQMLEKTLSGRS